MRKYGNFEPSRNPTTSHVQCHWWRQISTDRFRHISTKFKDSESGCLSKHKRGEPEGGSLSLPLSFFHKKYTSPKTKGEGGQPRKPKHNIFFRQKNSPSHANGSIRADAAGCRESARQSFAWRQLTSAEDCYIVVICYDMNTEMLHASMLSLYRI